MLRRLHPDQPDSFDFTPENRSWAEAQITKFPEGRQASAIIPLLWRAQEQEGWLSRPAIEHVAEMLGMAYIRALEVATFYFMFQLQPVGSVAHVQVCGTTSCMICGAEDLIGVCREKIAPRAHALSADGRFSWEEVECLGACANAPMVQIGKDYYEDLTAERFAEILDEFAAGKVPVPGPQNGRFASEPVSGLTSLGGDEGDRAEHNASVALAVELGDTIRRIDGSEVPLVTPWRKNPEGGGDSGRSAGDPDEPRPAEGVPVSDEGVDVREAEADEAAKPNHDGEQAFNRPLDEGATDRDAGEMSHDTPEDAGGHGPAESLGPAGEVPADTPGAGRAEVVSSEGEGDRAQPERLSGPRDGKADDLKRIRGVGPKLEQMLNSMGFYHFDQIASWNEAEITWVDDNLEGFRGRVSRDDWVGQARQLASTKET